MPFGGVQQLWNRFRFPWVAGYHVVPTYMGAFSGETVKPHMLISNLFWTWALNRDKPSLRQFKGSLGSVYTCEIVPGNRGCTKRAITGGPALKDTQNYTDEFGKAFKDVFRDFSECSAPAAGYDINDFEMCPVSFAAWRDLHLTSCLQLLSN